MFINLNKWICNFINENVDDKFIKNKILPASSKRLNKMKKLKDLLELVSEVDIMYHEENKEYFFEWIKDGKNVTIWLGDYV